MGHPKGAQEQGHWGNLFRNCHTAEQCLQGGEWNHHEFGNSKIPQAEQETFGDAPPAGPALHSLSVRATKSSFMENQINKDFPHLYWHYINFKPTFSGESLHRRIPLLSEWSFQALVVTELQKVDEVTRYRCTSHPYIWDKQLLP